MLNNIADWNELNRGGIFRFERSGDVVQTAISTDTLRVRQVLYQADGEPVFVNISGERVSRLRSLRFFLDYELSWEELGDDTNDFLSVVSDLVGAAINDEPVLFCPQPIWDDDKAVVVLFEPEEEIFEIYYDKQARKLPAVIKLKSVETFELDAGSVGHFKLEEETPTTYRISRQGFASIRLITDQITYRDTEYTMEFFELGNPAIVKRNVTEGSTFLKIRVK